MKKVGTKRMQAAEMRMMCGKTTLRHGTPKGLLRDRTCVEDIENHMGENRLNWFGHLERMDETNLINRVSEEKVRGDYEKKKTEKVLG